MNNKIILKIIIITLLIIPIVFLASLIIWGIMISAIALSIINLATLLIILPMKIKGKYWINYRVIAFIFILLILFISLPHNMNRIETYFNHLEKRLSEKNVCEIYSTKEKLSVYLLNIYMGTFGYVIYPNAAKETLLMIFKSSNGVR